MPNDTIVQSNNYTLTKLIRTGISPLSAMIGTSAYYGQLLESPVLGSINALLFSKKLGIDIWNLNQIPSTKTKLLNSSKKILLGLGTIGLANYSKFINEIIEPITPTTPIPTTTSTTPSTTTTDTPPWPPNLLLNANNNPNNLMDWDTYLSLNSYGIANVIAGVTELIPSKFENIRKIANMITGGALISSGVAMGINNEHANLINNTEQEYERQRQTYGSNDSIDSLTSNVIYERPVYCSTTVPL
ncbi:hypothetical protein [Spiroplasma endosymbiont of Andrena trimmerana]|uniref:hypothetical protein n=1 Tax=Spiroplasma endosymbiont of Andrena trimmerana TaxID=3066316 RepID=UPI0030CBF2F9